MHKDRPLGINLIFLATLFNGIAGLLAVFALTPALVERISALIAANPDLRWVLLLFAPLAFCVTLPFLLLIYTILASYNAVIGQNVGLAAAAEAAAGTPGARIAVLVISIFSLWLSYAVYELKKGAWYILVAVFSLALIGLIPSVFAQNFSAIAVTDFDKIGLIILGATNLTWLIYALSGKAYFVH
jgi:hypothetical protein